MILSISNIKKGIRYLKNYGIKEFFIRLKEKSEPEEISYQKWFEKHKVSSKELEAQTEEIKNWPFKPCISICVPSGVTEVEKKAVEDATYQAGAREVAIIEEPIAAAIGAGIDIAKPCGNMIVDIGGGTTDIAVISLGGTVVSTSVKIAGDDFDEAIVRYMRKKHNLLIGERTAEDIKIKIGSCFPLAQNETMDVRGRNLVTGLPRTITVSSEETEEALREATLQIVEAVHSVLEKTPPELAADVADRGIVLTGGGALLREIDKLISNETKIPVHVAVDPLDCVATGMGYCLERGNM